MTSVSDKLPPLRDVLRDHGLMAKKSLGQNFLLDLNITAKIARSAGNLTGKNVIEIGPGPGGLTRALIDCHPQHVYALEKDERCVTALQDVIAVADGKLTVHETDAITVDYQTLCPAPRAIVANLPYNIATPLLIGWLKQIDAFDSLTLMFQKEVAERIIAEPRSKSYGRLSVLVQWLCDVEKKFDLPPQAFTPPPKVSSSIVHFIPKENRTDHATMEAMEKLTAAAFGQRRKMLRQSLKPLGLDDIEGFLTELDIPPTARAEEVDINGFIRMAEKLS